MDWKQRLFYRNVISASLFLKEFGSFSTSSDQPPCDHSYLKTPRTSLLINSLRLETPTVLESNPYQCQPPWYSSDLFWEYVVHTIPSGSQSSRTGHPCHSNSVDRTFFVNLSRSVKVPELEGVWGTCVQSLLPSPFSSM